MGKFRKGNKWNGTNITGAFTILTVLEAVRNPIRAINVAKRGANKIPQAINWFKNQIKKFKK